MYNIQCKRLVDQLAFGLSLQQAEAIVARAYGRESYDSTHDAFGPASQACRPSALLLRSFNLNDLSRWLSSCEWPSTSRCQGLPL